MESETLRDKVEVIGKLNEEFTELLKMKQQMIIEDQTEQYNDDDEVEDGDDEEEEEEEEEFSFARMTDAPPIAAEEVFYNGQIRPLFPLFNQNLLLSEDDLEKLKERSPVNKIFIQTEENSPATSSSSGNQEIAGPFCEWSKDNKAIEASSSSSSPEVCKKSNSTGFSKLWRFKDFLHRSNSDGRDAFVFLNPTTTTPAKTEEKVKVSEQMLTQKNKKKKGTVVKKSEGALAHEAYMKSKAKDEDRRRSYLPYRPELVGFFTNVNGGLTRNVHPF